MKKIGLIALYELRRRLNRPWWIGFNMIMPLVLIFILGSALSPYFDSKGSTKSPVIVAAIGDQGPAGDRLHAFLMEEENSGRIVLLPAGSREEMNKRLAEGKADTGIFVPPGFSDTVLRGDPVSCDIVLGGSSGKSYIGQMIVSRFMDGLNDALAAAKLSDSDVSAALKATPVDLQDQDFIRKGKLSPTDKRYTALQYYGASMLVMFMLYSGLMAAISLVDAKENHTLLRLYSMPIRPIDVLAGKVAGLFIIAFFQAVILIVGTRILYGVKWGSYNVLLALICLLVITCSMSFAVMIGLYVRTSKGVHGVFQPLIISMTLISGGFSPDIGGYLAVLRQFTVSHWAVQGILHLMLDSEWTVIVRQILFLGLITAVLVLAAMQTFRKAGYR